VAYAIVDVTVPSAPGPEIVSDLTLPAKSVPVITNSASVAVAAVESVSLIVTNAPPKS
jgi:hypothetical protein